MDIVVVTGLSGSGKSRAINALEDIGYFCVDNMPPKLIATFTRLLMDSKEEKKKAAIVSDIRVGSYFKELFDAIEQLKNMGCEIKVLFLDSSDSVLIRRYKETRRKHPLLEECGGSVSQAIKKERELLQRAKTISDYVIDTSFMSPADLKNRISELFLENPINAMKVHCMSFGFKYGAPNDCDLMFDVRCLPNPFYVPDLKEHTGLEKPVRDFVLKWDEAQGLRTKLCDLVDYLVPLYEKEGKSQLVIAVGCTGGKHRSVVFAQLLNDHLEKNGCSVTVNHRDMNK